MLNWTVLAHSSKAMYEGTYAIVSVCDCQSVCLFACQSWETARLKQIRVILSGIIITQVKPFEVFTFYMVLRLRFEVLMLLQCSRTVHSWNDPSWTRQSSINLLAPFVSDAQMFDPDKQKLMSLLSFDGDEESGKIEKNDQFHRCWGDSLFP